MDVQNVDSLGWGVNLEILGLEGGEVPAGGTKLKQFQAQWDEEAFEKAISTFLAISITFTIAQSPRLFPIPAKIHPHHQMRICQDEVCYPTSTQVPLQSSSKL